MGKLTPSKRSRDRLFGPNYANCEFEYTSGATGSWTNGPYLTSKDLEYIDDVVTPNYQQRIAAGEIINNPCTYTRNYTWPSGTGFAEFTNIPNPNKIFTQSGPITARSSDIDFGDEEGAGLNASLDAYSLTVDEARAKLVAIANIDATPYAFGEDAFEVRETLRFLRKPLGAIGELADAYRKKRNSFMRKGMDFAEASASAYLQYQFAFSPLVRSCTDALEAYSNKEEVYPERLSARGYSIDNHSDAGNISGGAYRTYSYTRTHERNIKASILYEVSNPIRDWKFRLGFRAKDFPTTLWQIVPLSFMVDRMFDVSRFSQGVMNLLDPNVKILAGSVREKDDFELKFKCIGQSDTPDYRTTSWSSEEVRRKIFSYQRTPWSPTFSDTLPKVNFSGLVDEATKMSELVALVIARLS